MIMFKACPRCKTGDVVKDGDVYGYYVVCLQCGFLKDLDYPSVKETGRLVRRFRVPALAA